MRRKRREYAGPDPDLGLTGPDQLCAAAVVSAADLSFFFSAKKYVNEYYIYFI